MQVTLSTQNNKSTNFKALKRVVGGKFLNHLTGEGYEMIDQITSNLKSKESFQKLCKSHDVFVNVEPIAIPSGILAYKGLLLEVYAKKIKKWGILELFKNYPVEQVAMYHSPLKLETLTWDSVHDIIENFIKPKDKMDAAINNFFDKEIKEAS